MVEIKFFFFITVVAFLLELFLSITPFHPHGDHTAAAYSESGPSNVYITDKCMLRHLLKFLFTHHIMLYALFTLL
jgi:hypothetical protein